MDARNLRVGNYVYANGEITKVRDVLENGINYSRYDVDYDLEDLEPIELTEEILLKCGFELKGVIFRINNGLANQFDVNYSPSRNIYYYDSSRYGIYNEVEIKYLHQLQNLYYVLTGEELNVTL